MVRRVHSKNGDIVGIITSPAMKDNSKLGRKQFMDFFSTCASFSCIYRISRSTDILLWRKWQRATLVSINRNCTKKISSIPTMHVLRPRVQDKSSNRTAPECAFERLPVSQQLLQGAYFLCSDINLQSCSCVATQQHHKCHVSAYLLGTRHLGRTGR